MNFGRFKSFRTASVMVAENLLTKLCGTKHEVKVSLIPTVFSWQPKNKVRLLKLSVPLIHNVRENIGNNIFIFEIPLMKLEYILI